MKNEIGKRKRTHKKHDTGYLSYDDCAKKSPIMGINATSITTIVVAVIQTPTRRLQKYAQLRPTNLSVNYFHSCRYFRCRIVAAAVPVVVVVDNFGVDVVVLICVVFYMYMVVVVVQSVSQSINQSERKSNIDLQSNLHSSKQRALNCRVYLTTTYMAIT